MIDGTNLNQLTGSRQLLYDRTRKRQPSENRAGRNEDAWDWTKRGVSTKVEANCSLPEMNNPQHLPMLRVGIWWERRDSNSGPTD